MEEIWIPDSTEQDDDTTKGIYFAGEHVWIQGVHITPFHCPGCLEDELLFEYDGFDDEVLSAEEPDCSFCEYFEPDTCRFLNDPDLFDDLSALFDIYRRRNYGYQKYLENRQILVKAIVTELRGHGRPLHYSVLTDILTVRYPGWNISPVRVLRIMSHRPNIFMKVDEGVYRVAHFR